MAKYKLEQPITGTKDFSGGLVTQLPPWLLAPSQCPTFQNCDPSAPAGIAKKRGGRSKFSATLDPVTGDGSISGLYVFRLDGSVSGTAVFNIATEGTKVYSFTASAWTDRTGATTPIANADCWMSTLANTLVVTLGWTATITTKVAQKWNGTDATMGDISVAPLGTGIPSPATAKYCASHNRSMWYANTNANTSGLWKSATESVDTWNTANDSFYTPVNIGDGDVIKGLTEFGDQLLVMKQNHMYVVYGTNFDEYRILPHRLANRGIISDRGWTVYAGLVCYASADGIYAVGPNTFTELSLPFKDKYIAISDKTTIAAGTYRDQVWFSFKDGSSATNNSAFVLDLRRGAWAYYTNIVARVFYRDVDGAIYAGLSTAGTTSKVMQQDQGTQDEGTSITQILETADFDSGSFFSDKNLGEVYIWVKPLVGGKLTVDLVVDGVSVNSIDSSSGYPSSVAMDGPTGYTAAEILIRAMAPQGARGKLMRVKLTNSDSAQTEIYGVGLEATVRPPVQADQQA